MRLLSALLLLCTAHIATAHEETPARIIGQKIDLHFIDHGIAGNIDDKLVFGAQLTDQFGSSVMVRKNAIIRQSTFNKKDGKIVGTIQAITSRNNYVLEFVGINKDKSEIHFTLNGEALRVTVKADDFKDNHFINPTYFIQGPNKLNIKYKMVAGKACYGCSANLVFMILAGFLS